MIGEGRGTIYQK